MYASNCYLSFRLLWAQFDVLVLGCLMGRWWSTSGHISDVSPCMTKEMRPAHRTDILCHAFLYYGSKTKQKLGNAINSWGPSGKSEWSKVYYYWKVHSWYNVGRELSKWRLLLSRNMKNLFHPFQVIGMEFLRIIFTYICCLFGIVSVTEETVQHWIENEKSVITGKDVHYPVADWRTTYFLMLQSYFLIWYYNYII